MSCSPPTRPGQALPRVPRDRRGAVRVVIGTRAAAFAPVRDLGLVAIWDDGDDLHDEPRAPYPHAREVLLMRAQETGVRPCWRPTRAASRRSTSCAPAGPPRSWRRATSYANASRCGLTGDTEHDLDAMRPPARPGCRREAFTLMRDAVRDGPVLVQTPRVGLRDPARLRPMPYAGPVRRLPRTAPTPRTTRPPECAWCATVAPGWAVPRVRRTWTARARARRRPDRRGDGPRPPRRPGAHLLIGRRVLATVDEKPAIVVATPGAEPVAAGGYAAVVLLDTWLLLARGRTCAPPRRPCAAGPTRRRSCDPPADGGRVLAVGDASHPGLQALMRWDPAGLARREIEERRPRTCPRPRGSPPSPVSPTTSSRRCRTGAAGRCGGARARSRWREPRCPRRGAVRYVVRVPRASGAALSAALGAAGTALDAQAATRPGRGRPGRARLRLRVRAASGSPLPCTARDLS